MITREDLFEYNVKEAIKTFKDWTGSESTGEELQNEIWEQKDVFGEIMFNLACETLGDEVFEK